VAILPGFPATIEGRLLFLPQNGLSTDGIYGKDYTYRELPLREMARVVVSQLRPQFASLCAGRHRGQWLELRYRLSREQA
jgi:homoaconitate hydratase